MIRHATQDDYADIAQMMSTYRPDYPRTEAILLREDEQRPEHCKHRFFIAETDDAIVGYGMFTQYADVYDPQEFHVQIFVNKDARHQGIGQRLLSRILKDVSHFGGKALYCRLSETDTAGLAFATKNGFIESSRRIESRITLADTDLSSLDARLQNLAEKGIQIQALSELDDPERDKKLYQIHTTVDSQVPMETPITPRPYSEWRSYLLDNPQFLLDGSFVAIQDGNYIGISTQFSFVEDMAYVELTGTLENYRQQGIATALKLSGIKYAKNKGYTYVGVTNDANNRGILMVNEKMGFQPTNTVINVKLTLKG